MLRKFVYANTHYLYKFALANKSERINFTFANIKAKNVRRDLWNT